MSTLADGEFFMFPADGGADGDGAFDGRALLGDVDDFGGVDDLFAGANEAGEAGLADLGEDDFFLELASGPDQDTRGLGHAFDHERGGHHWEAGEVVMQMIFRQRHIFERNGSHVDFKFFELVDPDPTHDEPLKRSPWSSHTRRGFRP